VNCSICCRLSIIIKGGSDGLWSAVGQTRAKCEQPLTDTSVYCEHVYMSHESSYSDHVTQLNKWPHSTYYLLCKHLRLKRKGWHTPDRCAGRTSLIEPVCEYTADCDAWPVRRQTYGYLPSRRALTLYRYSFPVPLRVGSWVVLSG